MVILFILLHETKSGQLMKKLREKWHCRNDVGRAVALIGASAVDRREQ